MAESEGDDLKDFRPWHERQPWFRGIGHALDAVEVVCFVGFVAVFGIAGVIFWFCGGAPW